MSVDILTTTACTRIATAAACEGYVLAKVVLIEPNEPARNRVKRKALGTRLRLAQDSGVRKESADGLAHAWPPKTVESGNRSAQVARPSLASCSKQAGVKDRSSRAVSRPPHGSNDLGHGRRLTARANRLKSQEKGPVPLLKSRL